MIFHPDTSRIMKRDVKPGVNKLFDLAIEGFEGSGETVNSKGRSFLASFKRLTSSSWILAANYPLEEAFEPIAVFEKYYLSGVFIALIMAIALMLKLSDGITKPLRDLASLMEILLRWHTLSGSSPQDKDPMELKEQCAGKELIFNPE